MFQFRVLIVCCLGWFTLLFQLGRAQQALVRGQRGPYPEKLTYRIEWRLITAGTATMEISNMGSSSWQTSLNIESAGVMTRLYKVLDSYRGITDSRFCGLSSTTDAQEGKRHNFTRLTFDNSLRKVKYDEHDVLKNTNQHIELDAPPCAYEITGALNTLRLTEIEPGKSIILPVTNGKKLANSRVEAQAKESIVVDGKTYQTVRYEAFLFDGVVYRRRGRLLMWLTDDSERLPVQLRLQMGFPIGNVAILLENHQKL